MRIPAVLILLTICSKCLGQSFGPDIQHAIQNLGHRDYKVRVAAVNRLESLAETNHEEVLKACLLAYQLTDDPEARWRAKTVLRRVVDKFLFHAPQAFLGVRFGNIIIAAGGQLIINGVSIPPGSIAVAEALPDTAAQRAGLQANDYIIEADGQRFEGGPEKFSKYVRSKSPGDKLQLTVIRGQETMHTEAILGKMPETEQQKLYSKEASAEFFEEWLRQQPAPPTAPTKRRAKIIGGTR